MPLKRLLYQNIDARLEAIEPLARDVAAALKEDPQLTFAVNLCLEELITNTVLHGLKCEPGHTIEVLLSGDENSLEIQLTDNAPAYDPFAQAPPPTLNLSVSERPIGGLGIHFVRTLMDSVEWQRYGAGNRIVLRKTLQHD